jgi:hypothetical protein
MVNSVGLATNSKKENDDMTFPIQSRLDDFVRGVFRPRGCANNIPSNVVFHRVNRYHHHRAFSGFEVFHEKI